MLEKRRFVPLVLDLRRFDGEGGAGGAGGEGGAGGAGGEGGTGGDKGGAGKTYDEAYVTKLRQEAADNRVKARDAETAADTKMKDFQAKLFAAMGIEADPKKDLENQLAEANSKREAAEKVANAKLIKAEVKLQAAELGVRADAVEAAFLLLDKEGIKIDGDNVTGVKEAMTALLEKHVYLKGDGKPAGEQGGKGNGGRQAGEGKATAWDEGAEMAKKRNEAKKATSQLGW